MHINEKKCIKIHNKYSGMDIRKRKSKRLINKWKTDVIININ